MGALTFECGSSITPMGTEKNNNIIVSERHLLWHWNQFNSHLLTIKDTDNLLTIKDNLIRHTPINIFMVMQVLFCKLQSPS